MPMHSLGLVVRWNRDMVLMCGGCIPPLHVMQKRRRIDVGSVTPGDTSVILLKDFGTVEGQILTSMYDRTGETTYRYLVRYRILLILNVLYFGSCSQ